MLNYEESLQVIVEEIMKYFFPDEEEIPLVGRFTKVDFERHPDAHGLYFSIIRMVQVNQNVYTEGNVRRLDSYLITTLAHECAHHYCYKKGIPFQDSSKDFQTIIELCGIPPKVTGAICAYKYPDLYGSISHRLYNSHYFKGEKCAICGELRRKGMK